MIQGINVLLMSGDELRSGVSGLTWFSPGLLFSFRVLSLLFSKLEREGKRKPQTDRQTDRQKEEQVVKGSVHCLVYPLNSS